MAAKSDNTAGIVIIGDEILSGKFADENAAYLIGALRELGVSLRQIAVIPDDLSTIAETVPAFSERFGHVFTSGGVGPTHDDVTMAGIAQGFGTTVVVHPALREILERFYGDKMNDTRLRLAEVPDGAELVVGERPDWPVVCYRNIYILPGVPSLFRRKFDSIRERFRAEPFVLGRIYSMGEESDISVRLSAAVAAHPDVTFGSYPRFHETEFKIILTIEGRDPAAVTAAIEALAGELGELVVKTETPK